MLYLPPFFQPIIIVKIEIFESTNKTWYRKAFKLLAINSKRINFIKQLKKNDGPEIIKQC